MILGKGAYLDVIKGMVAEKRKSGISLTTLGFGTGNYNEQLMELLNGKLQSVHGVVATETLISLEQSLKREIPINVEE